MNLILIRPEEISSADEVVFRDRRAQHLLNVVKVRVDQELRAGIVRGARVVARVVEVGPSLVRVSLSRAECDEIPWLDLILALPRPKALPRIVQAVASFGVRRIDIVNAWRVDPSYFASPKLAIAALELDAWLGCEQGGQTYVPEIGVHRLFVPFVEGELDARIRAEVGASLLIAHPRAQEGVEAVLHPGSRSRVMVAVGPDGGFIESELSTLASRGGVGVHFGRAVLRSETAVVAILSQLDLLRRLPQLVTAGA